MYSTEAKNNTKGQKPPLPVDNNTKTTTTTTNPHDNDVLCGRGGSINSHPGNEQFRQFVERKKRIYLTARFKLEKRLIASSIVDEIRELDPPGRFLTKDRITRQWIDIGDEKARDKVSQALRENAPTIRKDIETEQNAKKKRSATPEPPEVPVRVQEPQEGEEDEKKDEEEGGSTRKATKVHQAVHRRQPQQASGTSPQWGYHPSQYDASRQSATTSVHSYNGAHHVHMNSCDYNHQPHEQAGHPPFRGYTREPDPRHSMPPPPPPPPPPLAAAAASDRSGRSPLPLQRQQPNEEFGDGAPYGGTPLLPASYQQKSAFDGPTKHAAVPSVSQFAAASAKSSFGIGAPQQPASHGRKSAFDVPKRTVGGDVVSTTQSSASASDGRHHGDVPRQRAITPSPAPMKSTVYPQQHAEQHPPQTPRQPSAPSNNNKMQQRSVHFRQQAQRLDDGEGHGGNGTSHDGRSPFRLSKYQRRHNNNSHHHQDMTGKRNDSKVHHHPNIFAPPPAPSTPSYQRPSAARQHQPYPPKDDETSSRMERWQQEAPQPASQPTLFGGLSPLPHHQPPRRAARHHDQHGRVEAPYNDHHDARKNMPMVQEQQPPLHRENASRPSFPPHQQEVPTHRAAAESSLLSQVAQHILTSFDNLSVGTMSFGTSHKSRQSQRHDPEVDALSAPSEHSKNNHASAMKNDASSHLSLDSYAISEEGQEVQLVEDMEYDDQHVDGNAAQNSYDGAPPEAPMPPSDSDDVRDTSLPNFNSRVDHELDDWSSRVGGCHAFVKETLVAASIFKNKSGRVDGAATLSPGQFLSPVNSMDMEFVGLMAETQSQSGAAGSVGGNSLFHNTFEGDSSMIGNGSASHAMLSNGSTTTGSFAAAERTMRGSVAGGSVATRATSVSSGWSWVVKSPTSAAAKSPASPSPYYNPDEALVPKPIMTKTQRDDTSISLNYSNAPTLSVNSDAEGMDDFIWSWDGKGRE